MPAESYGTPEEWHAQTTEVEDGMRIAALGPYPARGEYEHCFTLSEREGRIPAADAGGVRLDGAGGGVGETTAAKRARRGDCGARSATRTGWESRRRMICWMTRCRRFMARILWVVRGSGAMV